MKRSLEKGPESNTLLPKVTTHTQPRPCLDHIVLVVDLPVFALVKPSLSLSLHIDTSAIGNDVGRIVADLVPIDDIPPRGHVISTAILMLEVVRVFPNVQAHDGVHDLIDTGSILDDTLHERIVLIGCADNFQTEGSRVGIDTKPDPATAKERARSGGGIELGNHGLEAAKA
jgi:hypothetical protein